MKKLLYPNCSELIADFNLHDPKEFYGVITKMAKDHGWMFDPVLTLDLLEKMVKMNPDNPLDINLLDSKGRITTISYGSNGYDNSLGFRLDSGCEDYDSSQYQFFQDAINDYGAKMKTYDGGHMDGFEEWQQKHDKT